MTLTPQHITRRRSATLRGATTAGFTLIELLIVIAIILVLVGLLATLLGPLFGTSAAMQCKINLRTIYAAYRQYLTENNDTFPPLRSSTRAESLIRQIGEEENLDVNDNPMSGGMHWSIMLWPYIRDIRFYTCPLDPNADKRGDVDGCGMIRSGSPFTNAPPLSYGLNTLLFRNMPWNRKTAGASWGLQAKQFAADTTVTTENDQRRWIKNAGGRVLFFCGAGGFMIGHQMPTAWRDCGMSGTTRSEWHPSPGPKPYQDSPDHGSHYCFADGTIEYRQQFPSRYEWALDLKR